MKVNIIGVGCGDCDWKDTDPTKTEDGLMESWAKHCEDAHDKTTIDKLMVWFGA